MVDTKSVTLTVHRAIVDDNFQWTLSELLKHFKSKLEVGKHIVDRGLFEKTAVKFPLFPKTNKSVAMTLALYEEGAEKSTIKPMGVSEAYSTAALSPPSEAEYLGREVAILVDGNYMVSCGLGNREGMLVDAICKLARGCSVEMQPSTLAFMPTPNRLTVEKIRSTGVQSVRFDAANFLGSLHMPKESVVGELFSRMTTDAAMQKDEMIAEISLSKKSRLGRPTIDPVLTPKNEFLERAAIKTFNDERINSYTIVLNDKTQWVEGDLKLNKKVTVRKDGSSYNVPEAIQEMLVYLADLQDEGHLR